MRASIRQPIASVLVLGALAACQQAKAPPTLPSAPEATPHEVPKRPAPLPSAPTESPRALTTSRSPAAEGLPLGTEDPVLLRAADRKRGWVVICQARADTNGDGKTAVSVDAVGQFRGDNLQTFFIDADGRDKLISEFVSSSPSGRFVAFFAENKLWVHDADAEHDDLDLTALGADIRDDLSSFLPHRAVTFSPDERYLLYYKRGQDQTFVLRELQSGTERSIHAGSGLLWRARFEPSGQFVVVEVVENDGNKNGKLEWPVPPTTPPGSTLAKRACEGPLPRYVVPAFPGDAPTVRLVARGQTNVISAPGYIAAGRQRWLRRNEQGALAFVDLTGVATPVASEACQARVLHVDSASEQVILACTEGKLVRSEVYWVSEGQAKPLGLKVGAFEVDQIDETEPRLLTLYPGQQTVLLDLETRTLRHLLDGDLVIATRGNRALVRRRRSLLWSDPDGGESVLSSELDWLRPIVRAEPLVAVAPVVVDLESALLVGSFEQWPLALGSDGLVLLSAEPTSTSQLPRGPLHWQQLTRPNKGSLPELRAKAASDGD